MKRLILVILLLNLFNISNFAQGEGAMPVMTLQTSLPLLGAGWIGTAKPNNDPIGFYLNPAILGYSSQSNHASLFFMPTKVDWIPVFGITRDTYGFNLGYNFKDLGIPISFGFGYIHDHTDYRIFTRMNSAGEILGEFNSYDKYDVYSIGVGIDYYLLFNFGMSVKPFESHLSDSPTENEVGAGKAEGTALDYGAMIIAPISKLFFDNSKFEFCNTAYIKPVVNFTLGYSLTNVGDEVVYFEKAQADPLSRTGRLGYTFDFGFDANLNNTNINIFTYSFTAEVEDILIEQTNLHHFNGYQSLLGDIDIWDNLVLLNSNDKVVVHKGHTLNLFETLTLTSGSFIGRGYPTTVGTSGYGLSSEGLFKIVSNTLNSSVLNYFANHFVIEYYNITIFKDYNGFDTEMEGISIHMKNIEF